MFGDKCVYGDGWFRYQAQIYTIPTLVISLYISNLTFLVLLFILNFHVFTYFSNLPSFSLICWSRFLSLGSDMQVLQ
jgi:cytochrome b subunit of formate dehydrogenase